MSKKGFTLVELIIAISLSALVMVMVSYSLSVFLRTWDKISAEVEMNQISSLVLSRISFEIRSSKGIAASSNATDLVLDTDSGPITYDQNKSKVRRKKNKYSAYLTAGENIGTLSFEYPKTGLVKINLGDGFSTKAYVRN